MIPSIHFDNDRHVDQSVLAERTVTTLGRMVVPMHRGLLQYADLSWPWVDLEESPERELLRHLAALQRKGIRLLVRELDRRNWLVDYGQFPVEFADLNFVALDHLWPKIVQAEQSLLAELHGVRRDVDGDDNAVQVIDQCITYQREILRVTGDHKIAEPCCEVGNRPRLNNLC